MSEQAEAPAESGAAVDPGQEPVSSVETGAPADTDPFDNAEVQSFDRTYVEKLRREAADHRTSAKPFKEAFDGYDDSAREAWLNLIQLGKTDERAAAEKLREIADAIAAADAEAEAEQEQEQEPQYLTKEQYEELRAQEAQQAAEAAALEALNKEITELGYSVPKDGEHPSLELAQLMWFAQFETGNDIQEAHKRVEASRQAIIDAYVQEKANGGKFPRQAFAQGEQAPAQTNGPKKLTESRSFVEEFLKGQLG